ncbi:hypothetical protein CCAX7_66040 [Capsulimonas corticalis]|uniref:Uncharacterized protein n=1 Tax=Capsulimonas corticalis TaxID=2219043 RepID=A0A402CRE4_9BACT|nr:DUF6785 family protein [Capsulimonas corticalis]BDI34553.1 hypothetical protein CCAX7_66040 [Capsulimonas corticalis]
MIANNPNPTDTIEEERIPDPARLRWGPVGLLTLILIVLNTGWIANSEMKTNVTEITISTLFLGIAFILFCATMLNLAARRVFGPRGALNQVELMMLYSLTSMSSVVAGVGHMGFFTPFLSNVFWYAKPTNNFQQIWPLLPSYIGPRDHEILRGFYEGHSTFFRPEVMRAWSGPLCVWSIFFLTLLWTTLCLAAIVRRRWEEDEHLPFPVVALPLEMTREGAPIYRNKLLWGGFAIPCFLHSLNSLASIVPALPSLPINTAVSLTVGLPRPWSALDPTFGGIHAAGIGFGYLINSDVLFSMWFFYLLRKAMNVWGLLQNWRDPGQGQMGDGAHQFPYTSYQAWGAWMALGLAMLWQGRVYFGAYFRRAFRGDPSGRDIGEPMTARTAVGGFTLGFLALCAFVWSSGGSWWLPVVFFTIYMLMMLALARLEAETAVPSPFLAWIAPQSMLTTVLGSANLGRMDSVHVGMLSWFNSDYRAAAMPHQLQAFVGQRRAGGSMRALPLALMLAAAFALVCALLWDLQLYYVNGAETGNVNQWRITMGTTPWSDVDKWLHAPEKADSGALMGMAAGAAITGILSFLRGRFVGFPLTPAAYVLNTSWANDLFWLDMFIAWVCKTAILRYGGMRIYRLMLPLFLGLILGDFITGAFWSIVGVFMHASLFRTFST